MIAIVYFICVSLFVSMIGLVLNILFPKLDFDREIVVIKQSMSSFLGIMINLIIGISVLFLTIKFSYLTSAYTTMLIIIMFYLTSSLIMYVWLSTEGVKKFNNL
jgi:ABC-2 type transport system permease protein